jgi:hypothetical protein
MAEIQAGKHPGDFFDFVYRIIIPGFSAAGYIR